LVSGQDGKILDLVAAVTAAIGAVVAYQGAIPKEKEVRVGIQNHIAGVAPETVDVPSVTS
jgi:hypothetical protein